MQYLLDNGENISRYLPCLVQNYSDDDTRMLDLILMNISSRQISDTELWQSYEILNQILQDKKKSGEKFGRVRDKLAELLGVSSAQIGKMENVSHNAIEPVIDAVQKGEVSIFTANEIAKLDAEEQQALVQQGDLKNLKHKDVKKKNEELKKCATSSTNSEPEKGATSSTNSEPDEKSVTSNTNSEPEKGATSSTKSESDEKAVIYDTISVTDALSRFIREHYSELKTVLTACTSTTDSDDEIRMIEEFQELLRKVNESET